MTELLEIKELNFKSTFSNPINPIISSTFEILI